MGDGCGGGGGLRDGTFESEMRRMKLPCGCAGLRKCKFL